MNNSQISKHLALKVGERSLSGTESKNTNTSNTSIALLLENHLFMLNYFFTGDKTLLLIDIMDYRVMIRLLYINWFLKKRGKKKQRFTTIYTDL